MRRAGVILSANVPLYLSVNAIGVAVALPARGQWLTHSFFTLIGSLSRWVIGLLVALIGGFWYPRRDHDEATGYFRPPLPAAPLC